MRLTSAQLKMLQLANTAKDGRVWEADLPAGAKVASFYRTGASLVRRGYLIRPTYRNNAPGAMSCFEITDDGFDAQTAAANRDLIAALPSWPMRWRQRSIGPRRRRATQEQALNASLLRRLAPPCAKLGGCHDS